MGYRAEGTTAIQEKCKTIKETIPKVSMLVLTICISTMIPIQSIQASPDELKYDNGIYSGATGLSLPAGFAVKFTPPSTPWTIEKVKFMGIRNHELEGEFYIEVWKENLEELFHGSYPVTDYFPYREVQWAIIDIPDIKIYGDFYVCVFPNQANSGLDVAEDTVEIHFRSYYVEIDNTIDEEPIDWGNIIIRAIGSQELTPLPDLYTHEGGLEPENPKVGDEVTFWADVYLTGQDSAYVWIDWWLDGKNFDYKKITYYKGLNTIYTEKKWVAEAGEHTIRWMVDRDGLLEESDETNNEAELTFYVETPPILNVQPKELDFGSFEKGQTKTKQITIQNDGSGELNWEITPGEVWVSVYPLTGTTTTETDTVDITVDTEYLDPGHYESWIQVISNGGSEYIDIIVDVTKKPMVELDIQFYSNKDILKYDETEARVTLKIKNIGVVDARDVVLDIKIRDHFEYTGETHFEWTLIPGEKKTVNIDVRAKRCKFGTFVLQGTFRDSDDTTKYIYEDFRIHLRDFIVIEYDTKFVDYSLSKDYVEKVKEEWYGPIQVASALWVVMAKMDLGLPPDDFQSLLEHIEYLYSILDTLRKTGKFPKELFWDIFDAFAGLGLNAAGLWIDCCIMNEVNDDGTLDYHSLWPLRAATGLLSDVVDIVIDAMEDPNIELPTISSYYTYFVDKEGKMHITVLADREDVRVTWIENVAFTIIEPGVTEVKIIINAEDAGKEEEEYDLVFYIVREDEITDEILMTDNIRKDEKQELKMQVSTEKVESIVRDFNIPWGTNNYKVSISTINSVATNVYFNQPEKKITFDVDGEGGTVGYCNVTLLNKLLGGTYIVKKDGTVLDHYERSNETHSFLSFSYQNKHKIEIIGSTVIPEFINALLMILIFGIATLASIMFKRRLHKT